MSDSPQNSRPASNRREFLTGRSVQKEVQHQANQLADALIETAQALPPAAQETVRLETRAMGCHWAVIMNPGPARQVMVASDGLEFVHQVEEMLTIYKGTSEVALLNERAAESPQPASQELFKFLKTCQQFWKLTDGAFDPTSGAQIQLWKESRQQHRIPTADEVEVSLQNSGFGNVELDEIHETVFFTQPGLKLDFGAIGKGYAVDLTSNFIQQEQLIDFLIHGGQSSMIANGIHGDHAGWPVGIRNPLFTEDRYATLLLKNQAISTSGSNVQYFRHEGRRFGHILDPRTGWPSSGLLSVSVISRSATEAEALSTAFYVMGLDKAIAYCQNYPEVGAILVPTPLKGRVLEPVVCNLPEDCLFFEKQSS